MKLYLMILMLIVLLPGVLAGSVAYGYIYITIDNKAPELTDMTLAKDPITQKPDCTAKIIDEVPDFATINKQWVQNGFIVQEPNFQIGSDISCVLTPVDIHGKQGADYELNFKVSAPKTALDVINLNMMRT